MRKNLTNILTKEILEYEYNKHKTIKKVAESLEVSIDSISKYMNLYKIPYSKTFQCIYSCNENFFKEESAESFYWAGFIAADGSVHERKNSKTKTLKIALASVDIDHINKFKIQINSTNPIHTYKVKPNKMVPGLHFASELHINSKIIFDDLTKFNIVPNKTKIYEFPEWLIDHPFVNHFMRGYFDGDGCITQCGLGKNRTVVQGSLNLLGTEKFINTYKDILIKNCEINSAKTRKHYSVFQISYSGNNNIRKLYNFLYKNSNNDIRLERKYNKIIGYL